MLRYDNDLVSSSSNSEVTEEHLIVICTIGNVIKIGENMYSENKSPLASMIEGFKYIVVVFL